jgi:hypothetical protein
MKNTKQILAAILLVCCVLCTSASADENQIVNGGFETGDISGWTLTTDGNGHFYFHEYNVSEEYKYSGAYGCELYVECAVYSDSSISLTQNVNLTDVDYITFNHQCTYEYSGTANNGAYSQLEFYVDEDATIIPLFNNSSIINVWKNEEIDVSNYTGCHNVSIRLYSTAPWQPYVAKANVNIDDISLVHAQDNSTAITTIYSGTVELNDSTFTISPSSNPNATYTFNWQTDYGALIAASNDGGFTCDVDDNAPIFGSFITEIDGISNDDFNFTAWYRYLNDVPDIRTYPRTVEDGDVVKFLYGPYNSTTYLPDPIEYEVIINVTCV